MTGVPSAPLPADKPRQWQGVSGSTMSAGIVDQVKTAVLARGLRPGQRLGSESTIAADFGVSRMAARDAIRTLEASGVVDVRVGKKGGIFVAQPANSRLGDALAVQLALTDVDPLEVIDAQMAIETAAIAMAAQAASDGDIARLRARFESFRHAMRDSGGHRAESFPREALDLHTELVAACHNDALLNLFLAIRLLLAPLYERTSADSPAGAEAAIDRVLASHGKVLDCLASRDAAGAQQIIRARLANIRDTITKDGGK